MAKRQSKPRKSLCIRAAEFLKAFCFLFFSTPSHSHILSGFAKAAAIFHIPPRLVDATPLGVPSEERSIGMAAVVEGLWLVHTTCQAPDF